MSLNYNGDSKTKLATYEVIFFITNFESHSKVLAFTTFYCVLPYPYYNCFILLQILARNVKYIPFLHSVCDYSSHVSPPLNNLLVSVTFTST